MVCLSFTLTGNNGEGEFMVCFLGVREGQCVVWM